MLANCNQIISKVATFNRKVIAHRPFCISVVFQCKHIHRFGNTIRSRVNSCTMEKNYATRNNVGGRSFHSDDKSTDHDDNESNWSTKAKESFEAKGIIFYMSTHMR